MGSRHFVRQNAKLGLVQQIAGWLRDQYPGNPEMWVSHEASDAGVPLRKLKLLQAWLRPTVSVRTSRRGRHLGEGSADITRMTTPFGRSERRWYRRMQMS
jgi:hypothetical protein